MTPIERGFAPTAAPSPGTLDVSIARGLEFLARKQLPSGEFATYMSTDHQVGRNAVFDSSPFATALITYSLGFSGSPLAGRLIDRAMTFFLAEMEGPGLWRYWTRQHPYHAIIPPDLDDIACISLVLRQHGRAFPSNRALVLANRDRRGLFYTWLTPRWPLPLQPAFWRVVLPQWGHPARFYFFWKRNESKRHDVDGVVNANVLLYLGAGEDTRAVVEYLIDIVRRGDESCCDKWHLNRFTFYYAVARNFLAGVREFDSIRSLIIERIHAAATPGGAIGESVLDTALAACALISLGDSSLPLQRAISYLVAAQQPEGEWVRAVLYYGGPKKYYGWGSAELTTGFCLEALLRARPSASDA